MQQAHDGHVMDMMYIIFMFIMDIIFVVYVISVTWGCAKENPQVFQLCCSVSVKNPTLRAEGSQWPPSPQGWWPRSQRWPCRGVLSSGVTAGVTLGFGIALPNP